MRSDVELLKILLSNLDKLRTGLCRVNTEILSEKKITFREYKRINQIIREHPTKFFLDKKDDWYYFKPGELAPRKEYLKNLIEELYESII